MALREKLDTLYLCWLAKPKADRELFRCVRDHQLQAIVEVGVDQMERTRRLLRLAQRVSAKGEIRYAGIDLFDARPSSRPRLLLKETHKELANRGASARLIPGDPFSALARSANLLSGTQLLIVSDHLDSVAMERAWMYVPRMLAERSWVFVGSGDSGYQQLTAAQVQQRADAVSRLRKPA